MRLLVYILFCSLSCVSFGQIQRCSTDEYREYLKERGLYNYNKKDDTLERSMHNSNYNIPVVVHVLYNNDDQNISDEQIYSQIQSLNNDYNSLNVELENTPEEFQTLIGNVGFSFCLVSNDPDGNFVSGINRVYTENPSFQGFTDDMKRSSEGGVDAWDTERYLNIWVCDLNGNTLGFATMPGDVEDVALDGVVIDYEYFGVNLSSSSPYNLGRTATHEIGHYFNLEHTFYAGCSDWDGCNDTPAISTPTYGCPDFPQESCQSTNMTMNFMDYTDDACMYMFTICQAESMIDALLNLRPNLLSVSDNCTVSINEIDNFSSVFPNPVIDFLNIHKQDTWVYIYNLYGQKIYSKYIKNEPILNISFIPSGQYILSVANTNYSFVKL